MRTAHRWARSAGERQRQPRAGARRQGLPHRSVSENAPVQKKFSARVAQGQAPPLPQGYSYRGVVEGWLCMRGGEVLPRSCFCAHSHTAHRPMGRGWCTAARTAALPACGAVSGTQGHMCCVRVSQGHYSQALCSRLPPECRGRCSGGGPGPPLFMRPPNEIAMERFFFARKFLADLSCS